jgi:hypothetical protein
MPEENLGLFDMMLSIGQARGSDGSHDSGGTTVRAGATRCWRSNTPVAHGSVLDGERRISKVGR